MLRESVEKPAIRAREQLLEKLRERIVGFAASRMQRDAAEDLAQEVLILLHEKYGHLDRLEDLLPLSLKIVRFKMMAYRQESAAARGVHASAGGRNSDCRTVAWIRSARWSNGRHVSGWWRRWRELGERCRKFFALKLEGKTFAEIQASWARLPSTRFIPGIFAAARS